MPPPGWKDNFRDINKALDNLLSLKTLNEYASGRKGNKRGDDGYIDGVIQAMIGMAASGVGPGNTQYADYSDSYNKQIARSGQAGSKRFLRGLGNTGREGGMLGRGRFSTEVDGSGTLWLVWTSAGGDMDKYWLVHDGRVKHKNIPPRPWLHLNTVGAANALVQALKLATEDAVADFNAKRMRTA